MDDRKLAEQAANRANLLTPAAIVAAALIVSWGMPRSTPKYQLAASGDMIVRLNTESGILMVCNPQRCTRVEPGRHSESFGPITIEHEGKAAPALPNAAPQKNQTAP